MKTLSIVTRKMPMTVQLLALFALHIYAVPYKTNAYGDLQEQTHANHDERRIEVRVPAVRLENVAHLIRVCGQQRQIHHTLGQSLFVLTSGVMTCTVAGDGKIVLAQPDCGSERNSGPFLLSKPIGGTGFLPSFSSCSSISVSTNDGLRDRELSARSPSVFETKSARRPMDGTATSELVDVRGLNASSWTSSRYSISSPSGFLLPFMLVNRRRPRLIRLPME
ncbi:hypothetical protein DBV15_03951 [Temnothorax longispinosus]|uniref:Uncharacterized protein n=1 Tax=Temnothorax longispinosus TaxID=300112 RepID=A0A4S2JD49_9HYME|nr:hypothetical protein DBV15_03951 [Temnothorax longispinosus]